MTARRAGGGVATDQADQIQATTILVEDRIASTQIFANTAEINQVAPFQNPYKGGALEALVISNALGNQGQLLYLSASPASATGWELIPIQQDGNDVFAREVIAYQNTWGGVDAMYVGTGGTLSWLWIEGDHWSTPGSVLNAPRNLSYLGISYSPGATSASGVVSVYAANPDGGLFLQCRRADSDWILATIDHLSLTQVTSLRLTMGNETDWQISFTRDGIGMEYLAGGYIDFDDKTIRLDWGPSTPRGFSSNRALGGLANQIYDGNPAGILLFIDPYNYFAWTCSAADYKRMPLPDLEFADAVMIDVTGDELTRVFAIDNDRQLWTMFQNTKDFSEGINPWSTPELLDRDIAAIYTPALARASPCFMALHGDGALLVHYQDPNTGFWASGPILSSTDSEYVVANWRTEVVLYNNGTPLPHAQLTVKAGSAVALTAGSECFFLDSNTEAVLETNILGKATFSVRASGTSTPALTFSSPGLPEQSAYSPSAPLMSYFNGTGQLPGWGDGVRDSFSPDVLKNASVHGRPVVPAIQGPTPTISPDEARRMIATTASLGSPAALAALRARGGPAGFMALKAGGRMTYREFATPEELAAALAQRRAELGADSFKDWVGNTWHAITETVAKVSDFFVDLTTRTIEFIVDVGNGVTTTFQWIADTIERAADGVVAAFNWLESKTEDVIDWIKAVFDFKAIWNTKKAFSELMSRYPGWLAEQLAAGGNYLQDNFFDRVKTNITDAFADAKRRYAGQTFVQQPKWQPMSVPPEDTSPVMGSASANDYANNPKANWFTNEVASYEPDQLPAPSDEAWKNFGDAMQAAGADFRAALDNMATVLQTLMNPSEPASFQNIVVPEFLDMVENLIATLVNLLDAVIQAFLAFGATMAGELGTFFTAPVELGAVGKVYTWLAKLGGEENPPPPTIADFFALLTAFPCTIIYKLINGADSQPFPDGRLPPAPPPGTRDLNSEQICLMCASIVTSIGLIPTLVSDFDALKPAGSDKSSWASGAGIAIMVISQVLAFEPYYVGFSPIEWGISSAALVTVAQFGFMLWAAGAISSVMKWRDANPDISAMGMSAFSVLLLAGTLVSDVYHQAAPLKYITTVLKNISGIASFLLIRPVQVILGGPVIAITLKMVIDIAGHIGGGILGTYLATQSSLELGEASVA